MYYTLAMYHNLHLLRRNVKKMNRFDNFKALVHQSSRIYGDLCAHVPCGMCKSTFWGYGRKLLPLHSEKGSAGCCQEYTAYLAARLQTLKDCGMLAVNRDDFCTVLFYCGHNNIARHYNTFLV